MAALACALLVVAPAGAATVRLFNVPSADSGLEHIVAGADGALWFTERRAGNLGRVTTAGQIDEYPIPNDASDIEDTGPDEIVSSGGVNWFLADIGSSVYRVSGSGAVRVYDQALYPARTLAPSANGGVWLLQSFGDGNDQNGDALVRLDPDGTDHHYPATHAGDLESIALAPDGAAWFNDRGDYLKRVTDDGAQTNVPLPDTGALTEVSSIGFAADGTPWYTEYYPGALFGSGACCGQIGWISGGVAHALPLGSQQPSQGLLPHSLVRGPDGAIWFAVGAAYAAGFNGIGRVDSSGHVQLANLGPYAAADIAFGSDGALWFIDQGANKIGRIAIDDKLFPAPKPPAPKPPAPKPPAPKPPADGPGTRAPRPRLAVAHDGLKSVRRLRRLVVSCRLAAAGRCGVRATIRARTARHLHLRVRRHAKSYTLGRASKRLRHAGKVKLRIKLSKREARALRHVRRLKLTLRGRSTARHKKARTTSKRVTLRRAKRHHRHHDRRARHRAR